MKKVLILTKSRYDYTSTQYGKSHYGNPIGLQNGAHFLADGLQEAGIEAKHVGVIDGNSIDKEVASYKPDIVVLEALWVTPDKVRELSGLHKEVSWVVRLHSNLPFLSMEGIAIRWCRDYHAIPGVVVAANNKQTAEELSEALSMRVAYLPNIYLLPLYCPGKGRKRHQDTLDVSCFGAIRPLKNQFIQAVAAMSLAKDAGKKLRFHINGTRIEQRGDTIVANLEALFEDTPHELVRHPWQKHEDFLLALGKMDLAMQVSLTESFNIVAADHVHVGIPLVVSPEISWLPRDKQAKATSVADIVAKSKNALTMGSLGAGENRVALNIYNQNATRVWQKYLA